MMGRLTGLERSLIVALLAILAAGALVKYWIDRNRIEERVKGEVDAEVFRNLIPPETTAWIESVLAEYEVPPLPQDVDRDDGVGGGSSGLLGWTEGGGRNHVEIALRHEKVKLLVNALGPPPKDVIDLAHEHGVKVAALTGAVEHALRQQQQGVDIIVAQGHDGVATARRALADEADAVGEVLERTEGPVEPPSLGVRPGVGAGVPREALEDLLVPGADPSEVLGHALAPAELGGRGDAEQAVRHAGEGRDDDDRAALGLAGIAVKAGARSAIATLWTVNDPASAALVTEFYRQLENTEISKAQALQRASGGQVFLRRVLRIKTNFQGMALNRKLMLVVRQLLAVCHTELPLHQVLTGNLFGHGMFHLKAGIHLHEVEAVCAETL